MTIARTTQQVAEVLSDSDRPVARVTQQVAEVLSSVEEVEPPATEARRQSIVIVTS